MALDSGISLDIAFLALEFSIVELLDFSLLSSFDSQSHFFLNTVMEEKLKKQFLGCAALLLAQPHHPVIFVFVVVVVAHFIFLPFASNTLDLKFLLMLLLPMQHAPGAAATGSLCHCSCCNFCCCCFVPAAVISTTAAVDGAM